MGKRYRVLASAPGLQRDALRALAAQLAREPDIELSTEQLSEGLLQGDVELLGGVERARAEVLRALLVASGASAEVQPIGEPSEAREVRPDPPSPGTGLPAATILGGFRAPSSQGADVEPKVGSPAAKQRRTSEVELLTLDQVNELSVENDGRSAQRAPGDHAARSSMFAETPPRSGADSRAASAAPRFSALDALDASSLVMLDGSDDDAPPPTRPATKGASSDVAQLTPEDPRFRPPESDADEGGGDVARALELDVPARPAAVTDSVSEDPLAETGTDPRPEDPPASSETVHTEPEPVAAATPRGQASRTRSARRKRLTLAVVSAVRDHALLRVALGFAIALGLGSILPMCHARSVMSTTVQELRVELSTAKAHGTYATPAFDSVEQIEEEISGVKRRRGAVSFVLWLASSGILLFLWFRFL